MDQANYTDKSHVAANRARAKQRMCLTTQSDENVRC
ncbi:hypothetical protein LMG31886_05010 [Xanthomonas hydrangeae]|nr:hypothetical protein LMG31884_05070 [Xanthomonas hydrangeae]CAD7713240.1 hypothetical protein LMG31884_05070 [Xanthomonas hydrangeae]CAD7719077.1 hypothetical protein LMG31887_05070 [Xanthomonas hydrangeae]CAD7719080.1 hypothetical protein LMG31887_05070 [Xanthomonas hydrangeae]CAD7723265.1 hypothetical protein LMG31886_05010 [Xanthomonas hydrangeae]